MINEKKLLENLIPFLNEHGDMYFAGKIIGIIDSQPQIGEWIPCSERLPEEPEEIPTEDEPVEEMVLDGKFKEYIVMIYGADAATTLYYIGSNNWYDGESGECYYRVEAWQPLPEIYADRTSK